MKILLQKGVAVIVVVAVLLLAAAYLAVYTSRSVLMGQRITANQYRQLQASNAANAGLEFGIAYFKQNSATILVDANNNGYIDNFSNASTTNVVLANGASYSITYTNPTANNFNVIDVSATGKSADNTATYTVAAQLAMVPTLVHYDNYPLVSRGGVSFTGNTTITNTEFPQTVRTGQSLTLNGNAKTVISTGLSSMAGDFKSDIVQNDATLAGQTSAQFFATYFGTTQSAVAAGAHLTYSNNTSTNYSSALNNVGGKVIYINQTGGTATLNGNTIIGTPTNPVILIVNGNASFAGNTTIYGLVFVTGVGNFTGSGNTSIHGALISSGSVSDTGNFNLTFNHDVLDKVKQVTGTYTMIPGSWRDL